MTRRPGTPTGRFGQPPVENNETIQRHLEWIKTGLPEEFRPPQASGRPPHVEWARRVDWVPPDPRIATHFIGDYIRDNSRSTPGDVAIAEEFGTHQIKLFVYLMNRIWYQVPDVGVRRAGPWGSAIAGVVRSWVSMRRIDRIVTAASMGRMELTTALEDCTDSGQRVRFNNALHELTDVIAAVGGGALAIRESIDASIKRSYNIWEGCVYEMLQAMGIGNPSQVIEGAVKDELGVTDRTITVAMPGLDALTAAILELANLDDKLQEEGSIALVEVDWTLQLAEKLTRSLCNLLQRYQTAIRSGDLANIHRRIANSSDNNLVLTLNALRDDFDTYIQDATRLAPPAAPATEAGNPMQRRRRRLNFRRDQSDDESNG